MQKFDLSLWLQDKSRKVVTRDGRPARIVCWDRNTKYWKIVGLVTSPDGSTENPFTYDVNGNESDGCLHDHRNDLFFADEEEELTEFERYIKSLLEAFGSQEGYRCKLSDESVKKCGKELLNLARKEILKDLPKYKKAKESRVLDWVVKLTEDGNIIFSDVVYKGEYFIMLQSLKPLPKEE